ncbi:MAG: hypothetical protein FWG42_12040 [Clostridiales bacterium]|nr:hypothetical protein [Clostridiales bacterium]
MGSTAEKEMEMATYRTRAEWNEIVEAYRKSGKTMKSFCEERGISPKTLGSHVNNPIRQEHVKRSMQEWGTLLDKQRTSGLPMSRWCREHEISESALRAAQRRQQSSQETGPKWIELHSNVGPATTVEKVKTKESGGKIKIRGIGLEIEADADYPVEKLTVFIGGLMRSC